MKVTPLRHPNGNGAGPCAGTCDAGCQDPERTARMMALEP